MSWLIGTLSVVLGLMLSYHLDLAGSAAMSATAVGIFFVTLAARSVAELATTRRAASTRL